MNVPALGTLYGRNCPLPICPLCLAFVTGHNVQGDLNLASALTLQQSTTTTKKPVLKMEIKSSHIAYLHTDSELNRNTKFSLWFCSPSIMFPAHSALSTAVSLPCSTLWATRSPQGLRTAVSSPWSTIPLDNYTAWPSPPKVCSNVLSRDDLMWNPNATFPPYPVTSPIELFPGTCLESI